MGGETCPLYTSRGEATAEERGEKCTLRQSEAPKESRRIGAVKKVLKKAPSERENLTLDDAGRKMTTSWTEVVKKGKAKEEKRTAKGAQSSAPKAGPKKPPSGQKAVKETERFKKTLAPKRKRPCPPRTAAVIILLPDELGRGTTYVELLKHARKSIKLGELGISAIKFRIAAT